jgi:hypothetical protein
MRKQSEAGVTVFHTAEGAGVRNVTVRKLTVQHFCVAVQKVNRHFVTRREHCPL